ncbi:histidine kinase [Actinomyces sp. HMSC075C01]|uniref:histidine kinase n=1 Tax=Actinomyces oris TaxID=544580 RepID=A0A1Q8VUA6_9ACTO|nr:MULTISPECIES: ATP-binding protein [Actinomyces]OFR59466.1 histidine kinase [Actinomyces sp. HMSC075C01]OLO51675.1 histidine kinase [Actinomyces oris]
MSLLASDTQTSFTWHPTRRTHLLHAGVAIFLLTIAPVALGVPHTPSALLATAMSLACLPLASRLPAAGAAASLAVAWFAANSPYDLGGIAVVLPWGLCIMLLGRGLRRDMIYVLAFATTLAHLSAAPTWHLGLVQTASFGVPCVVIGEVVRHHRLQANVAEQERRRKLDQQRRLVVSELHDTVVRDLSHAVMIAEQARLADPHNARLNQELTAIITPVRTAVEQLRRSLKAMSATEGDDSLLLLAASPPPPLTDTIHAAQEALTHRDAHLTTQGTDLLDNPSIGPGIRQQLVRIIAELINNAAKYTPPSSTATLTIEADNNTLECMCTNPIDPDQPTSTATSSQLGLIQAQQRVESLGGSLHTTHATNRWTTIFTIPLHRTPPTTTD